MKQTIFTILSNRCLTADGRVFEMILEGDTSDITTPGQFVNIALEGRYLRRPISVSSCKGSQLTLVYKVVGVGTAQMSAMGVGARLDLLTGLGNGFSIKECVRRPLVVGGGVGVPPLLWLTEQLRERGLSVETVLGFNRTDEIFYADRFAATGAHTTIATADGSVGVKGFVTDAIEQLGGDFDYLYCCGPMPMLRAVYDRFECDGQFSFEERMGCGFGICMGCSCHTTEGSVRICREGPVLERRLIVFDR